jgi:hypothetical protein
MIAPEWLETGKGQSRELGLVAWGGATLRRLLWWRRVRDGLGDMLGIQARSARRGMRRRAIGRALRQALGLARPV